MGSIPSVSVVMPAYCAAKTIAASIKSVQDQSLSSWELIIVDDGSTDNTVDVVSALANEDDRIRLICQNNQGPSAARNLGVEHARADVLAFLDADDFWAPERLNGMLAILVYCPDAGVLFSRTRFFDADTEQFGTLTPHAAHLEAKDLMAENAVCSTSNILCRKAVFEETGGFANGLHYAEDQDWLVRVALAGKWQIRGIDAEWFFYRSSEASQSADLEAMRLGWLRMVSKAKRHFPKTAPLAAQDAFGPLHRQLARRALRLGQPKAAVRYLFMALSQDPSLFLRQPRRTVLTLLGSVLAFIPNQKLRELIAK